MRHAARATIGFAVLFVLYQSAEGIGQDLLGSFAVQAVLMVACVLAAWPVSRWLGWKGYGAYALGRGSPIVWAWFGGALALAVAGKFAAVAVGLHWHVYASASGTLAWRRFGVAAFAMLLVSTFVASLAEDILARGFWYRAAGIRWRRGIAFVLFSSAVYVLNHIYRLGQGPLEWMLLFCYGLACAAALWRSGSLWAALGLHWGWNLANGLLAVDTLRPTEGLLLSAAVHVLFLLIVLAVPVRRREGASRAASGA